MDFAIGQRVELHPCTDAWMSGDRFGTVTKVNVERSVVYVRMDVSKRLRRVHPNNVLEVC